MHMKSNKLAAAVLLVFVAASVAAIVARGLRSAPADDGSAVKGDKVVAYYFHTQVRCPKCVTAETVAKEVVTNDFSEQIERGELQWRAVNYMEPGNKHFEEDYNLIAVMVCLVRYVDGEPVDHEKLVRMLELADDKPALKKYVHDNLAAFLKKSNEHGEPKT